MTTDLQTSVQPHHREDETFYVFDGELRLFVGDRESVLAARQAALAPRGVPHTYRVESDRARWIVINSPAGFEQLLEQASKADTGAAATRGASSTGATRW